MIGKLESNLDSYSEYATENTKRMKIDPTAGYTSRAIHSVLLMTSTKAKAYSQIEKLRLLAMSVALALSMDSNVSNGMNPSHRWAVALLLDNCIVLRI